MFRFSFAFQCFQSFNKIAKLLVQEEEEEEKIQCELNYLNKNAILIQFTLLREKNEPLFKFERSFEYVLFMAVLTIGFLNFKYVFSLL